MVTDQAVRVAPYKCSNKNGHEPRTLFRTHLYTQEFAIPRNGLQRLILNFVLQNLIDTERAPSAQSCEACSCSTDQQFVRATVNCVNCSQRLCERCSLPHRKMKGGAHDVRPLGDELRPELEQTPRRKSLAAVEKDIQELNISGKLVFIFLIFIRS